MSQFWSKIKTQYGTASQAISNLSLTNSEHDGDIESDTIIHNALEKYYLNKDGHLPQWLGVPEENVPQFNKKYLNGGVNQSLQQTRPAGQPRSQSSSLQEIYKRRQQQQIEQQQQPLQHLPPPQSSYRIPIRPPGRSESVPENVNGSGTAPDRHDKFRNKLRSAGGSRANW